MCNLDLQTIQVLQNYGIIGNDDTIRAQLEMSQRKEILEKHKKLGFKIHQLPDKRWYTRLAKSGKVYTKSTKEQIEQLVIEYYTKLEQSTIAPCFRQVYKEWEPLSGVAIETIKRYRSDLNRYFPEDHPFCKKPLADVTYGDLDKFVRNTIIEQSLTAKAYGNMRILMNHVFKYAWREHYTALSITDFFDNLDLPKSIFAEPSKKRDDVYTAEERRSIYYYCMENPTPKNLAVALICVAGFRVNEVSTFKPEDNFKKNYMIVHRKQGLTEDENGSFHDAVKDHAKQGHDHEVFIASQGQKIVNMAKLQMGNQEFLFCSNGRRVSGRMITHALQKICASLNIKYRSPHQMRKSDTSIFYDNGVGLSTLQKQNGHKQASTTLNHYYKNTHTTPEEELALEKAMTI